MELGIDARLVEGIDDAVVLGCRANPEALRIDPSPRSWISGDTDWYHGVIPDHWTNRIRLFCGRELYTSMEWGLSVNPILRPGRTG